MPIKRIAIGLPPQLQRVEVILSPHLLFSDAVLSDIKPMASRFALFCDENVAGLLGKKWCAHLQKLGLEISLFTFPSGEQEKSRERKAEHEDELFSQKFGRDSCIIALGGGVTTDLIGFLASTFCRGVPLINAPTTLLGMVDAAIGGKTGINTHLGKNLIGSFYPADRILIDPTVLSTLPTSEWTSGSAEVIKYSLIRSPQLFQSLKKWNPKDPVYVEKVIYECVQIKAQVVEMDYEETTGLRRILNFGHTIAHALEWLENYHISHGEAVAIGMLVESHISMKMGLLSLLTMMRLKSSSAPFQFKLQLSNAVTIDAMRSALILDKKSACGAPRFVLLDKIGSCCPFAGEYCSEVPQKILEEALAWMTALFSRGEK